MKKSVTASRLLILGALFAAFFIPKVSFATTVFLQPNNSQTVTATYPSIITGPNIAAPVTFTASNLTAGFTVWETSLPTSTIRFQLVKGVIALCTFDVTANQFFASFEATSTCSGGSVTVGDNLHIEVSSLTSGVIFHSAGYSGSPYAVITDSGGNSVSFPVFTPTTDSLGFATTTANDFCDQNVPYDDSSIISATITAVPNGLCRVGAFLIIPSSNSLLSFSYLASSTQEKIPFSYVYGLRTIFSGLTASSTANFSAFSLSFPAVASTSPLGGIVPTTLDALSTTTISTYMPESFRLAMLNFQRVFLWLGLAYLIYRRVIPHHVMESKQV